MYVSNCLLWFINYLSQPNHTQPQKHSNKHHHQTYRMFSKLLLKTCQGMEPDSCREAGWSCWEIFRHRAIRKNQAFRRPQNSNVTMALWLMVLKNNEKMWYNLRTINHSVTKLMNIEKFMIVENWNSNPAKKIYTKIEINSFNPIQ